MHVVYPCPKCNNIKLSLLEDSDSLFIQCDTCGFKTNSESTEDVAIQTWNKEYEFQINNKNMNLNFYVQIYSIDLIYLRMILIISIYLIKTISEI